MQNSTRASAGLSRRGPDKCFATIDAVQQHHREAKAQFVLRRRCRAHRLGHGPRRKPDQPQIHRAEPTVCAGWPRRHGAHTETHTALAN
jgi:hypothetical protein